MKRSIELVIFDLDGTLVDAYRAVAASLNHALKKSGYKILDDETIKRSVGWGDRNLVAKFVRPSDIDKVLKIYRRHHKKALKKGTVFLPGVKEVLRKLRRQNFRLAVASNRPSFYTHIILRHLKVRSWFDYVLCADQVKRPKPAPDLLKGILQKASLKPRKAIYIGDMHIDVQTGHRAKIKTVSVLTGSCTRKQVAKHKPYKIVTKLQAIINILSN